MADEALTAGAVARRLGVAVTTLRTWHQRYGLGPSQHIAGQHRRYTPEDMARLQVMRRLTAQGVAPAEAAAWAQRVPVSIDMATPPGVFVVGPQVGHHPFGDRDAADSGGPEGMARDDSRQQTADSDRGNASRRDVGGRAGDGNGGPGGGGGGRAGDAGGSGDGGGGRTGGGGNVERTAGSPDRDSKDLNTTRSDDPTETASRHGAGSTVGATGLNVRGPAGTPGSDTRGPAGSPGRDDEDPHAASGDDATATADRRDDGSPAAATDGNDGRPAGPAGSADEGTPTARSGDPSEIPDRQDCAATSSATADSAAPGDAAVGDGPRTGSRRRAATRPRLDVVWPDENGPLFVARDGGGHSIRTGRAGPAARGLARAAMRLDGPALRDILEMTVTDNGVIAAWEDVIMPVLVGIGERYEATQRFIEVEHLLSRGVTEVLGAVARPPSHHSPRVLLAAADEEQHTLPLEALAAALAQAGVPSRLLGARVPPQALGDAIVRTGPAAVVLWSQLASTGNPEQWVSLLTGPHRPLLAAAGGPGWARHELPEDVTLLGSLAEAVRLVSLAAVPADRSR